MCTVISSFKKPSCAWYLLHLSTHEQCQPVCQGVAYQFVFEPLSLDEELDRGGARGATGTTGAQTAAAASTVGAAAVLRPADLIDGDAA